MRIRDGAWDDLRARWLQELGGEGVAAAARRVDDTYLPVLRFCRDALATSARTPAIIGINGPQGAGKSTLAAYVVRGLEGLGSRAIALSIDDFYLTHDAQRALAGAHPDNPFLEHRGYPGTHDVGLGVATLDALRAARTGDRVSVPAYDKSAHGGRGDRAPKDRWPVVEGPLDAIVFEGWMLGFSPVADAELADPLLRVPNAMLEAYAEWTRRLDAFVHLELDAIERVVDFRVDAERARRAAGATALTDDEARDYVLRFLPAYRLWTPGLNKAFPTGPTMRLTIGADRLPLRG